MKRQPPAPKYALRCLWCGASVANGNVSWTVHDVCEDLFGEPTAEPVDLRDCGCLATLPCRHEDGGT